MVYTDTLFFHIADVMMKKTKTTTQKPAAAAKAEQPVVTKVTKTASKKPNPKPVAPAKIQVASSKPAAATTELTISERVGLTAGSIWHYLSENGPTSVTTLVAALTEDEKIVQRSIGWLAQEDKITIASAGRIETIALKA